MMAVLFFFWVVSAVLIILERKIVRLIIHLGILTLLTSACFLFLAAPDVALAEVVINVFLTIIFLVACEKHYRLSDQSTTNQSTTNQSTMGQSITGKKSSFAPILFVALLCALFIFCIPTNVVNQDLKNQYLANFRANVGGENAVTAIYLGYRMYDTLFEALMLLCAVMAIIHLSWHKDLHVSDGKSSHIRDCDIAGTTIRFICPLLLLVSMYLMLHGHLSPGGGFQGGVVLAAFFVCRYMIHDIYDVRIDKVLIIKKIIFVGILLLAVMFVFAEMQTYLLIPKAIYLQMMNLLIGMKVGCGFFVIFYRFIALERK